MPVVEAVAQGQGVVALSAEDGVCAIAADEAVIALVALEDVVPVEPRQGIGAVTAKEGVGRRAARHGVSSEASDEQPRAIWKDDLPGEGAEAGYARWRGARAVEDQGLAAEAERDRGRGSDQAQEEVGGDIGDKGHRHRTGGGARGREGKGVRRREAGSLLWRQGLEDIVGHAESLGNLGLNLSPS